MIYVTPLISELENLNSDVQNDCENYVKSTTDMILAHLHCLAAPIRKRKRKRNKVTHVSLSTNVNLLVSSLNLRLIPGKTTIKYHW